MNDEETLLTRLREMWVCADPVPDGLTARMIAAAATADLDSELLQLVSSRRELAGVRGGNGLASGTSRLEFSNGEVTVLVLVGTPRDGVRRLDGWVSPARDGLVRLDVEGTGDSIETDCAHGRFSIEAAPLGIARLMLVSQAPATSAARTIVTPAFEI